MDEVDPRTSGAGTKAREMSVHHLQELYAVVVAVGLGLAIERFIDGTSDKVTLHWSSAPVLLSYVVTLVPFYHGAQRHLDESYILNPKKTHLIRQLLMADFSVLFIQGGLLFCLAALLRKPGGFGWTFVTLLLFDAAWIWVFSRISGAEYQIMWAIINVTAAVAAGGLLAFDANAARSPDVLEFGLLVVAAGRTVADYWSNWDFYFP